MAGASLARRGVVAFSFIAGGCARLLRGGRRGKPGVRGCRGGGPAQHLGVGGAGRGGDQSGREDDWADRGDRRCRLFGEAGRVRGHRPLHLVGAGHAAGRTDAGTGHRPDQGHPDGRQQAGTKTAFMVQATDSENPPVASLPANLSITVTLIPLAVTPVSLPPATADVPYSAKLAATGGIRPAPGQPPRAGCPRGLNLNAATGVISGRPTAPGTASFTVSVSDAETPPPPSRRSCRSA